MKKKGLAGLTEKLLTPTNILFIVLGLAVFIVLGILLFKHFTAKEEGTIRPDQIKIQKGEKIVIVNEDGLIEYRSPSGVFYDAWDSQRIDTFFNTMREKAREYLKNPNPTFCQSGYHVTLYVDGKEVTICVSEDDEVLNEVFEEFSGEGEGVSLTDIFDDFFEDESETGGYLTGTPTPTPTPLIVSVGEGEEPSFGNGAGEAIIDCSLFEFQVTGRTVISNTLCIPEVEEEEE